MRHRNVNCGRPVETPKVLHRSKVKHRREVPVFHFLFGVLQLQPRQIDVKRSVYSRTA